MRKDIKRGLQNAIDLRAAIGIIFSQDVSKVCLALDINERTFASYKYRYKRNRLSYEKQKELVLKFGFTEISQFRFVHANVTLHSAILELLNEKEAEKISDTINN